MPKQKKIPMRMCIVTKERVEKKNLIRIVKTDEGIKVDPTGKVNGHGVYIKKDIDVINKAKNNKILNGIFNEELDESVYLEAINLCK